VAVQTICSYLDEESSPKVKLKRPAAEEQQEEQQEKEEKEQEEMTSRTHRLQQLLNFALKVIAFP
jgi:hypothetical protein